jgi:hypothetical protein
MNMRHLLLNVPTALAALLLLSACSTPAPTAPATAGVTVLYTSPLTTPTSKVSAVPPPRTEESDAAKVQAAATKAPVATATREITNQDLTLTDEQGAVVIKVKPLNLSNPGEMLDFDVAMNTHSANLGMDLAALATLTTDNGRSVPAAKWDGPAGGHHVEGTLQFPAATDGTTVLAGATRLTLTIRNVDAPERVFTWALQ